MLGTIFFILGITQALVGLAMMRSRFWMYRALPLAAFATSGVVASVLRIRDDACRPGDRRGPLRSVLGSFCFSMVFHALPIPKGWPLRRVNESLVE